MQLLFNYMCVSSAKVYICMSVEYLHAKLCVYIFICSLQNCLYVIKTLCTEQSHLIYTYIHGDCFACMCCYVCTYNIYCITKLLLYAVHEKVPNMHVCYCRD